MPKNLSVIPDVKMNPTHGRQIADAYDALKHNPNDPEVKEAYDALTSETLDQFNALREEGFQFTKMKPGDKPQTVDEVFADIKNKKLKYYPSEQGFGTGDLGDHPMLKPSGIKDEEGKDIPHNDIFRIVHDIQGHGLAGSDFSPEGEHKAFLTHRKQFSEKAHPALFTETAGQANWGAYNKKSGESNRRLIEQGRESELEFAEQKAGILPEEIVKGKWHEVPNKRVGKQFIAAEPPNIKPVKFVGIEGEGRRVTKMNPKDFLDRASSTGLEESLAGRMNKLMNNSGVLSDLGGVHTGDPENPLVKSRDFSSYGTEKAGINSVNKILGTGKDTRDENLKKHMERREIFRGDELGTIEFLKRKLRRGDPIERPQFDLNERDKVVGHEGRHRSRALLEEGIDEEEVTLFDSDKFTADHPEFIVGERNSLDELKRNVNFSEKNKIDLGRDVSFWDAEKDKSVNKRVSTKTLRDKLDTIKTDTRAPIFGRFSKQKVAVRFTSSFGPDLDAIDAFKKGENYQGYTGKGKNRKLKFEVKDGVLKLHGHPIATKTDKGIVVSNAGFDTGLTYSSLKELGINAKRTPGGKALLHNKEIDAVSGEKVLVPFSEVSDKPIRATKTKKRVDPRRTVTEQSQFREKVLKKELAEQGTRQLPLASTQIQPKDQKQINKITGVKSPLPKPTRATDAHHILPVHKYPGLRNNLNNAIMLTRKEHKEIENLNPALLRRKSAKLKKQLLAARLKAFTHSSSFVGNMRYDQDEQSMTGILSGKHYKWCDVSEREFDAFQGAGSKGAFFNRNIKGQHDCGSGGILSDVKSRISKLQKTAGINPLVRKKKKGRAIKKVSVKNAMSQTAKMISADGIANKFQEFMRNNDISKLRGTFDPVNMRIIDASNSQGAIDLQRLFESKSGKVGFNSITDTRKGPVTDMDIIRSQLREIEQAGGQPSIGLFDGSLEANKVLVDVSDDEILADLLESQRSTGIIDENTEFRIIDNPKYKEN